MLTKMRPLIFIVFIALLLGACSSTPAAAEEPTPTPVVDRLAAPPLPENPTQADLGAQVYYQVCMACHGDRGQGLTEEWRAEWGVDSNCWQSGCHGPDHPPWGFSIQKTCCPPVIEGTMLTRFKNAKELFQYLVDTMPWWSPGSLTTEEYWQLTAFLVRKHGGLPENVELEPVNAVVFNLHPSVPPPGDQRPQIILVASLLILAAGFFLVQNRLRA
jgi:hypothetical protein